MVERTSPETEAAESMPGVIELAGIIHDAADGGTSEEYCSWTMANRAAEALARRLATVPRGLAQTSAVPEPWQDDPASDERWNAGCDFAMIQLCHCLAVDPKSVRWDAATETLDGDVCAVIWNILRAKYGEDWDPHADTSTAQNTDPLYDSRNPNHGRSGGLYEPNTWTKQPCPNFPGCHCTDSCIDGWSDTSPVRPDGADDLEHLDGMFDDRERG